MSTSAYDVGQPATTTSDDPDSGAATAREPDLRGKGKLLEESDRKKVVRQVKRLWKSQDARMKPIVEQWRANELTMEGVPGVRVTKDVDTDTWFARIPIGASAVRVGISKARELAEKTTAVIHVDPAAPDCQPSPDDDGDRAKADLCTRILKNELTESGCDLNRKLEAASDLAATYGSGFVVIEMDPAGAGWRPLAVNAHPAATHYDPQNPDALVQPPPDYEEPDPTNPLQPATKYVGEAPEDGGLAPLVDDPEQAAREWQLKPRARVITGRQLRFLPLTATGIDDADAVLMADVTTFGTLRGMFPEIDGWPKERQTKLMTWRPLPLKDVLPPGLVVDGDGVATVEGPEDPREGYPADDALCMTLAFVARSHPAYMDGALILCAGETVLYRDTRCVWIGEGKDRRAECLDIHVVQERRRTDPTGANPYGVGDAELLAPGDDLVFQLQADAVESLWRVNHPNVFVPYGSIVQPGALGLRDDTPHVYNPQAGAPVVYEQPPGMDPSTIPMIEMTKRDMNARSGLEDAQQLNAGHITSGKQANAIVEQSLTILSPLNRNHKSAFARGCRVLLQLYRAFATQPMLLRYTADDGRYVVKEFVNTDLGSARDVRIAAGTSTMLSQSAKASLAAQDLDVALKAGDTEGGYRRYRQAMAANLDPQLGRDVDPHHHRVLRQIHQWREGPPKGEEMPPPQPPPPPMMQPDPMTGAPVPVQPPPPDPMQTPDPRALALFQPVAADALPTVARTRMFALADELARETTEQKPRPWVLALEAAFTAARQAAGVPTVEEQQQMAAQQQQAQAQAEQAKQAGQAQQRAADLEFKAREGDANRAAAVERANAQSAARGGVAA